MAGKPARRSPGRMIGLCLTPQDVQQVEDDSGHTWTMVERSPAYGVLVWMAVLDKPVLHAWVHHWHGGREPAHVHYVRATAQGVEPGSGERRKQAHANGWWLPSITEAPPAIDPTRNSGSGHTQVPRDNWSSAAYENGYADGMRAASGLSPRENPHLPDVVLPPPVASFTLPPDDGLHAMVPFEDLDDSEQIVSMDDVSVP